MKKLKLSQILFIVLVGFAIYLGSRADIIDYFSQFIDNNVVGIMWYIAIFALITVLVPLTAMPMMVPGSVIFGPFFVSIYSIIGWVLGAIIAFAIARYLGKPFLSLFIKIEEIERYEKYLSNRVEFWGLVFLRMIMPVDMLSYAVGILSSISFRKYILATVLGITPFAFAFSYIGDALVQRQYISFIMFSIGAVLVFGITFIAYKIYRLSQIGQNKDNV